MFSSKAPIGPKTPSSVAISSRRAAGAWSAWRSSRDIRRRTLSTGFGVSRRIRARKDSLMKMARVVAVALCLMGLSVAPAFAQKPGPMGGVEVGLSMSRESPDLPGLTITRDPAAGQESRYAGDGQPWEIGTFARHAETDFNAAHRTRLLGEGRRD